MSSYVSLEFLLFATTIIDNNKTNILKNQSNHLRHKKNTDYFISFFSGDEKQ